MAPTAFGNLVAIPHPITAQKDHSFFIICTLKKPIEWANKRIQFICLLNVEKGRKEDLQHMYDMLGKTVDNVALIQQLIRCKTYRELINILIE